MTGFYWIVSYPKSGNTWLRLALCALLHPERPFGFPRGPLFAPTAGGRGDLEESLDLESTDLTERELLRLRPLAYRALAAAFAEPLYRKVHEAWSHTADGTPLFPPDVTLGTIYIARDPRDVAVSWTHHFDCDFDMAVTALCSGDTMLGVKPGGAELQMPQRLSSWSGHVRSWLDAPGRAPCVLRYEDMLADPAQALRTVARYASIPHDDGRLEAAVAATGFDRLREQERRHGFDGGQVERRPFFRKGRAGCWRDELPAHQEARLLAEHGAAMARLGYAVAQEEGPEGPACAQGPFAV